MNKCITRHSLCPSPHHLFKMSPYSVSSLQNHLMSLPPTAFLTHTHCKAMTPYLFLLFLLLLLLPLATSTQLAIPHLHPSTRTSRACYQRCRFFFCIGGNDKLPLVAPNAVNRRQVCRRGINLLRIMESGNPILIRSGRPVNLSDWNPRGLSHRFPKNLFSFADVFGQPNPGIRHLPTLGNQLDFLHDKCVKIPVRKYLKWGRDGPERVSTTDSRECISFQVKTRPIIIEARWRSGDDMDLSIREPDRTVVDHRSLSSQCGRHRGDTCVDCCGFRQSGAERVTYNDECGRLQGGMYTAVLRQQKNCGEGPSIWKILVVIDGKIRFSARGLANETGGAVVGKLRFHLTRPDVAAHSNELFVE